MQFPNYIIYLSVIQKLTEYMQNKERAIVSENMVDNIIYVNVKL